MQRAQHVGHVLVHLEVVARRPLVVDVARRALDAVARAAHVLDDAPGVLDEDLRIVDVAVGLEQRRRGGDRAVEGQRVDGDVVPRTEVTVADALERRARVDQREVDVEEDGAGRA